MEPIQATESATFVLDPAEAAEVRKLLVSSGNPTWLNALCFAMILGSGVLRLGEHGLHLVFAWLMIGLSAIVAAAALAKRYILFPTRSHPAKLIFDSRGIHVVQNSRTTRTAAYAAIARVRILPSVIVIQVRWARALVIPRRSLPDNGATLIRIFEDRLVAKRMLVRQSPSSVIVNTASP